jgi:glycosyltransferase involved in cell wall biosynthesis
MKNILFVTQTILLRGTGGGVMSENLLKSFSQAFCTENLDLLLLGPKEQGYTFSFPKINILDYRKKYNRMNTFVNHFIGLSTGINASIYKRIKQRIKTDRYDVIIFDGSSFGFLIHYAKKNTRAKIITYFQNIEYDFYRDFYKKRRLSFFPVYKNIARNEKLSAKHTDYILLINKDEQQRFTELYHRDIDMILPISLEKKEAVKYQGDTNRLHLLFVGSDFFANVDGIVWFINNVMPHTDAQLTIAGKGMDTRLSAYNSSQITVAGYVENLAEIYARHQVVVAPIFLGSGMKVKIAEAFMYGKFVICSEFAFSGYEKKENVAAICHNAQEFIDQINSYPKDKYFNQMSIDYFDAFYSCAVIIENLTEFMLKNNI